MLVLPVKPSPQGSPQTEAAVDKEDPAFFSLSVFSFCWCISHCPADILLHKVLKNGRFQGFTYKPHKIVHEHVIDISKETDFKKAVLCYDWIE